MDVPILMGPGVNIYRVPAVLHTFYLGELAGKAIGQVLSGESSPGGMLPFTNVKAWDDFDSVKHYVKRPETVRLRHIQGGQGDPNKRKIWTMDYKEGLSVGYRHFDTVGIKPQFPFGHGLSYANFKLTDFQVSLDSGLPYIQLSVENTGEVAGSEVVQCYVRDCECSLFRQIRNLRHSAR